VKSSLSSYNGNCVEVCDAGDVVWLRDSKDPDGLAIPVPARDWEEFLVGAHGHEFDRRADFPRYEPEPRRWFSLPLRHSRPSTASGR
jgi:hypothetical protein